MPIISNFPSGLTDNVNKADLNESLATKQDKLSGTQGQIVGFDKNGNAIAQTAPDTGVTTFNGRTGTVKPQNGDYTADQVGARPNTWTPTAADVGALASDGTAAAATKLATARTIDGVSFNGTAAITHYGACSTAAATAAKVVTLTGFSLVTGAKVAVKFTVTNTAANPTLNVNNTGAKAIYYRGAAITAGYLAANRTYEFVYNGTQYELVGDIDTNTIYTAASVAPKAAGTAAVGTSVKYAREDHVHPAQTTVSGNAGSATKLATSRNLKVNLASESAASFNGTANASLGVEGILPVKFGGTGVSNLDDLKTKLGIGVSATTLGVSSVLNDNSWENIKKVSDQGYASSCWAIGDAKQIKVNGTVGSTAINMDVWAFILGFNHNSSKEGSNRIHFQIGKVSKTGNQICFVDVKYGNWNGTFTMNGSTSDNSTNAGGWNNCSMRTGLLGQNPASPAANTFMAALPSDLRAVMKSCTKYSDNTGGSSNAVSAITATTDYLWLLSEFEVHGVRTYASQYEQNFQLQYDYYKVGNKKVFYRHNATTSTARWWLRSVFAGYANFFCFVSTDGSASYGSSGFSFGVAPAFCV